MTPTALVKGSGPSGLAAALFLAQESFSVTVVEKRAPRTTGAYDAAPSGRRNMVAIRPEALHQLDVLGVLPSLSAAGALTPITQAATVNELDGSVFEWPLATQRRYEGRNGSSKGAGENGLQNGHEDAAGGYVPPGQLDEQVPSSFVTLGDLEEHMVRAAEKLRVKFIYERTVKLRYDADTDAYDAAVVPVQVAESASIPDGDWTRPDLVVCASGKGDAALTNELGFERTIGNKLEDDIIPEPGSRDLRLGPSHEMESQKFCVFGVTSPEAEMGILKHVVRKYGDPLETSMTSKTPDAGPGADSPTASQQPVVEIEMRHAAASHCLLQLPRGFQHKDTTQLEAYVLDRINQRLQTSFPSIAAMRSKGVLVWGDPLTPVVVETATAPRFAFGQNVVLVGDAGMSCSPSSGLGADVGLTHDGQAIRALGRKITDHSVPRGQALDEFNREKAKGAVMWSKGSQWFYITEKEASEILGR